MCVIYVAQLFLRSNALTGEVMPLSTSCVVRWMCLTFVMLLYTNLKKNINATKYDLGYFQQPNAMFPMSSYSEHPRDVQFAWLQSHRLLHLKHRDAF